MELKLGHGIGALKFGIKQAEVEKLFGKPDRILKNEDVEKKQILIFNKEKIRVAFYENEDNKLGAIETANPNITINNLQIIGTSIETIKKEFSEFINDWDQDEYDFITTYFNDKYWLTLSVEYDVVTRIELGIPFKDEENYDWPVK